MARHRAYYDPGRHPFPQNHGKVSPWKTRAEKVRDGEAERARSDYLRMAKGAAKRERKKLQRLEQRAIELRRREEGV